MYRIRRSTNFAGSTIIEFIGYQANKKEAMKMKYDSPVVKVTQVRLEESLVDTVNISASPRLLDWEDGEELGDESEEGGDIYLTL